MDSGAVGRAADRGRVSAAAPWSLRRRATCRRAPRPDRALLRGRAEFDEEQHLIDAEPGPGALSPETNVAYAASYTRLDHRVPRGRRSASSRRCSSESAPGRTPRSSSPPAGRCRGGWPGSPWSPPRFPAIRRTWWRTSSARRASPATGSGGRSRSPASPRSSSTRACGGAPACSPTWNSTSCATPARRPARCAASAPSTWGCSSTA